MKAMVINGFGDSSRLEIAEVPNPEAQADEVMIRVAYAGVNPVDWKIREGMLEGLFPHRFPLILGWDAAGTVPVAWPSSWQSMPARRCSRRQAQATMSMCDPLALIR
jgi:NADPH:quinone reductase-like Zn-dependent oxidoreductase